MRQYKQILVFYLPLFEMEAAQIESLKKQFITMQERTGYEIIWMHSEETRVEIFSVDKVTIVEDIQKYIDLQSIKEKEL